VEAPIWDCEGAAHLLDGSWPLVTSLHTTLHFWLQQYPARRDDALWMREFGEPMLALEQELMQAVHGVRANSHAIGREIEKAYGFQFDLACMRVVPHGMPPAQALPPTSALPPEQPESITVLFVGRLEARKGIDVLLAAIPGLLAAHPQLRFRILGDNTLPQTGASRSYQQAWCAQPQNRPWLERVTFEGWVDDATLQAAYRACDIFVAPSRFESFGLVFLEAMRVGKPVIGCHAGGMPEVVDAGVTGLLPPPGDSVALAEAIAQLAASASLRTAMGESGRARFLRHFTAERMAAASIPLFDLARANFASAQDEARAA
jgi:glycosyltransferase involved in cell wall biosynthesis